VIDGDGWPSLLGNVCARSENSFAEGGLDINVNTSVGRSMNGRYTSAASGVKDEGVVSPDGNNAPGEKGEGVLDDELLYCGLVDWRARVTSCSGDKRGCDTE
jgi:hypothetical protein